MISPFDPTTGGGSVFTPEFEPEFTVALLNRLLEALSEGASDRLRGLMVLPVVAPPFAALASMPVNSHC